ncbi:LuxR family transcriptional regulator [Sphingomonas sp. Leaf412]|uniref:response regulator n=1 Tax=Sphingomonas sp. Leaf412 TaxID=1736370 RepID=UPI0006FE24ED|nr:response regulator transcription factor [Sphingomonas sp. Leaf412]KQT31309.1 LuxR family transcriptional regulator [Sphingomonas sp. Leaf412]
MAALRILVTDDHPLTREGLSLAARAAVVGAQVDAAGSVADAAGLIERRGPYRLILLDFALPDSHGYAGMLRLQQLAPTTPIVIVTAHERANLIEAAKALGAAGFVLKSQSLDDIAAALRAIAGGRTHFPDGVGADPLIAAARDRIGKLSKAQYAVLLALADGRSNKQIAHDLDIAEATVKAHLTTVFRKLGVTNRSQALLAAGPLLRTEDAATP